MEYNVDKCHEELLKTIKPSLAFDKNCDYDKWRSQVKEKLPRTGRFGGVLSFKNFFEKLEKNSLQMAGRMLLYKCKR